VAKAAGELGLQGGAGSGLPIGQGVAGSHPVWLAPESHSCWNPAVSGFPLGSRDQEHENQQLSQVLVTAPRELLGATVTSIVSKFICFCSF